MLAILLGLLVDQFWPRSVDVQTVLVVDKTVTHTNQLLYVGKNPIFIPKTDYYLCFWFENELIFGSVEPDCYSSTQIGDIVEVQVRKGVFSVGYYPICP